MITDNVYIPIHFWLSDMRALAISLGLVAICFASAVRAEQEPLQTSKIVTQQQQIRSDVIAKKGRYAKMPSTKRDELLRKQSQLLGLLENTQTTNELGENQRIEAFNTLEWIEAAINDQDNQRMICRKEHTLGSNRTTTVCRTKEQMDRDKEDSRERLDQMQRGNR